MDWWPSGRGDARFFAGEEWASGEANERAAAGLAAADGRADLLVCLVFLGFETAELGVEAREAAGLCGVAGLVCGSN